VFEVQEKFFDSKAVQDASLKASLDLSTQSTLGEAKKGEEFSKIPNVKLLGCIGKTYWVGETVEGLVLIDQHVVQERILYEKFMKEYIDGNISVQKLISPEVVDLDVRYASRIKDNLEKFKEFGFEIEEFGDNTFRISTVPVIFGSVFNKIHLLDLLGDMRAVKDYKEKVVIRMACRSSIKAGDEVSEYRLMALLRELDKCELPFTCPHGRPIIIKLGMSDLEKMFRRK
jgi:DNA mismatch repair protein MutL